MEKEKRMLCLNDAYFRLTRTLVKCFKCGRNFFCNYCIQLHKSEFTKLKLFSERISPKSYTQVSQMAILVALILGAYFHL